MRLDPTDAEWKLWQSIRDRRAGGFKFRRQTPRPPYIADFVCVEAKLIVEVDGNQHADSVEYDTRRTRMFERQGYRVIRFWNNEVMRQIEAVVEAILAALGPHPTAARSPSPRSGEG